ncbi:hypothetical protein HYV10_00640 [Candidatus Dependentiae bacterium]|nr:hypothetical protein [Candidatus Dependentiae bacterium]
MHYSLIIQYPYESIDIALCQNGSIVNSVNLHKFEAIGKTIPTIELFLKSQQLNLSNISFLAANVGPGPYNTLRAILTMLNGIYTVKKIPLIGLNALDLLSEQIKKTNYFIGLNAFENHIFYKLKNNSGVSYAANNINEILNIINSQPDKLIIQGNSAIKYEKQFKSLSKIIYPEQIVLFNNLETLASLSYQQYIKNNSSSKYLKPIYFEELATTK